MLENIGPRGRTGRMTAGVLILVLGVGAFIGLLKLGFHPLWRLTLFLPFWVGVIDILQAWRHCCVVLAARGLAEDGRAIGPIQDASLALALRRLGAQIAIQSFVLAAAMTAAAWLVPHLLWRR